MKKEDLIDLTKWGSHEDLRFLPYNFPYKNKIEYTLWYNSKNKIFTRKIFSIIFNKKVVGYITLKKINWIKKSAEMGISIDANCLSKGIGTLAIIKYLETVFIKYRLKKISLRAALFNKRAIKCYKKVGFNEIERKLAPFEDQTNAFKLIMEYDCFTMIENKACCEYVFMNVNKSDFMQNRIIRG
ncbi:GNAT family N-acetyltransferase [Helicovermis profundi]